MVVVMTGASLAPFTDTVNVAVLVAPAASLTVYVNVSVNAVLVVFKACTLAFALFTT